ncbi:MAG: hypothetical protein ACKV19_22110 [Verrucomicrobiales bacterium]
MNQSPYRSKSFVFGCLGLAVLIVCWWDSKRNTNWCDIRWGSPSAPMAAELQVSSGAVQLYAGRPYQGLLAPPFRTGIRLGRSSSDKVPEPSSPVSVKRVAVDRLELEVAYWFIVVIYLVAWAAVLVWVHEGTRR